MAKLKNINLKDEIRMRYCVEYMFNGQKGVYYVSVSNIGNLYGYEVEECIKDKLCKFLGCELDAVEISSITAEN